MNPPESNFRSNAARQVLKWSGLTVLVAILLFAGYTALSLTYSYADGDRAGFVLKLSRKGWICKTWEGEMQMVAIPGAVPEKFYFTVRDDALADKINSVLGKQVTLHYKQHVGVPSTCFGETQYFAQDVIAIRQ